MRTFLMTTTLVLTLLAQVAPTVAKEYEKPPELKVSEVLAPDVAKGQGYQVSEVASNGYMFTFVLESDYGKFETWGERTMNMRIREIGALNELENLSKSEVFVKGVGEGAVQSLKGLKTLAEHPVSTAKGVPEGVGRFFKRTKHDAKAGYGQAKDLVTDDDEEEDGSDKAGSDKAAEKEADDDPSTTDKAIDTTSAYAKKYFGVNSSRRRWAQKLEVDPYSSNKVLQKAIGTVADVDAAARFAVRLAPIPRVPGARYANKLTSLVWTREPWELVEENTKLLIAAGATEEMISEFFANVAFSPTLQTAFVASILDLQPAQRLGLALEQAQGAASEDEARFFVQGAAMLRWFHHKQSPIASLVEGGERVFVARASDDRTIVMLPVDHLYWTEEMAETVSHASEVIAQDGGREMWLAGDISDRARSGIEALGWKVRSDVAGMMKADPVEVPDGGESGQS